MTNSAKEELARISVEYGFTPDETIAFVVGFFATVEDFESDGKPLLVEGVPFTIRDCAGSARKCIAAPNN